MGVEMPSLRGMPDSASLGPIPLQLKDQRHQRFGIETARKLAEQCPAVGHVRMSLGCLAWFQISYFLRRSCRFINTAADNCYPSY